MTFRLRLRSDRVDSIYQSQRNNVSRHWFLVRMCQFQANGSLDVTHQPSDSIIDIIEPVLQLAIAIYNITYSLLQTLVCKITVKNNL